MKDRTQEEKDFIESCQKDMKEFGYEWVEKSDGDWKVRKLKVAKVCKHCGISDTKYYEGFSDSFEYCGKCDKEYGK